MSYSLVMPPVLPTHIVGHRANAHISAVIITGLGPSSSGSWPAANRALYLPIFLPVGATLARFFEVNNSATNNVDVGIYTDAGVKITTTGSVARTLGCQYLNVTDVQLGPGKYYLGMASDATSNFFQIGPSVGHLRVAGVLQEAAAFPLPATMTGATVASAYLPIFGFTQSSTQ